MRQNHRNFPVGFEEGRGGGMRIARRVRANHGTALFGPPTTCNTSQCTYRWRIRSGDRWRSQPSRNHGTRCARSNNDVVVAGFEIFLPRGLICCDCENLICERGRLGGLGAERGMRGQGMPSG